METSHPPLRILDAVARDKLPQVLAHVADHLLVPSQEVFSAEENDQLKGMLSFSDQQIDAMVRAIQFVYRDAAAFSHIDQNLLSVEAVSNDVVRIVEKVWRKKGRLAAEHVDPDIPTTTLQSAGWQLHLEMGQGKVSGQTNPTAVFQLEVAGKSATGATESTDKFEVEMNHDELRKFFAQLNTVQAELDQTASSVQVPPSA